MGGLGRVASPHWRRDGEGMETWDCVVEEIR